MNGAEFAKLVRAAMKSCNLDPGKSPDRAEFADLVDFYSERSVRRWLAGESERVHPRLVARVQDLMNGAKTA